MHKTDIMRRPTLLFRPQVWLLFAGLTLAGCHGEVPIKEAEPIPAAFFEERIDLGPIEHAPIREASGLVASRKNPNVLWTHNDSGDTTRIYALNTEGKHLGTYTLEGAQARDWEDIALGPGPEPGKDYLYIGDIGDNRAQYDLKYVYRVPEPAVSEHQPPVDTTLTGAVTLTLRYPDGRFDAETLMLDPLTKDLYVVTKRDTVVQVYRAAYPPSTDGPILMERVMTLSFDPVPNLDAGGQGAVGGDISPSGRDVLIKTYTQVYHWSRPSTDAPLFAIPPETLPYVPEPQGEAIAWAADENGYYTLSEERQSIPARLYFYRRGSGMNAEQ
ncbi:MAG: hypothetical protein ACE5G0_03010 [Rhodothermales bacterium]